MKRLPLVTLVVWAAARSAAADSDGIRLNTLGYLPAAPKSATLAAAGTNFIVRRVPDNVPVLEAPVVGPVEDAETQRPLYTADFSALTNAGQYRLEIPGQGTSAPFRVADDVYREPFRVVTRAMYLWRCGTAVTGVHDGATFTHGVCHTRPGSLELIDPGAAPKDSPGGWHDAGDYNRYVVNAGVTVGTMFRAWEDFGTAIRRVSLDIPESGGRHPEFLAEIKWELDWLLTLQAADGSVYHKLSARDFCGMILPEHEAGPQLFAPWSSAATADFTAMLAAAARCFRESDPEYAARCLRAAQASHAFLQAHPENHRADLSAFSTGAYATQDGDDRLWAAAELWETTGDATVLEELEGRIRDQRGLIDVDFDWSNVKNLGLITYLNSDRPGRDPARVSAVAESLVATADRIVETARAHAYARPMGRRYYWGCNGSVARQTLVLCAAYRVSPKPDYRDTALDAVNHLFGRNPYGRSYVTGLGHHPPMHPHDRRSVADGVAPPWPGYLVGGPHRDALSWEDAEENYRGNEIAINWNGALIYALAAFLEGTAWNTPSP